MRPKKTLALTLATFGLVACIGPQTAANTPSNGSESDESVQANASSFNDPDESDDWEEGEGEDADDGQGGAEFDAFGRDAPNEREEWGIAASRSYASVVDRVASMVSDSEFGARVERRGLNLINVAWEDTGRAQGSSIGPNISDLTLQVRHFGDGLREQTALMPVIRFPNFSDRTGDIAADKFLIRVGNHRGRTLTSVPLRDVLRDIRRFAADPDSILGSGNLLARRDTHFLVSAQALFLPIPRRGRAEFNPVVFNYQSAPGSPAVLTLLVTREGTSMQVIENRPEDQTVSGFGQELYFNNRGQRAAFTAERQSDVERRIRRQGGPRTQGDRSALARGADVLFLVQVPLRHHHVGHLGGLSGAAKAEEAAPPASAPADASMEASRSDVERAVLGHGRNRGPFVEGGFLPLERDPRFPIRITVQFYKATSNGIVSDADLDGIARNIGSVYEHADFVGSLVLPEGDPRRPTAWQSIPRDWFPW